MYRLKMPSTTSLCYSISFHPSIEEWGEYKQAFLTNFKKKYKKYIIVPEKGNKNYYSHYQAFVEFDKECRADTVRKSAYNILLKDIEISYPRIALKLTPITRDVKCCQGYTLKETDEEMKNVISTYDSKYLVECKNYYLDSVNIKRVGKDKQRLTLKNLPEIFRVFVEVNKVTLKTVKDVDGVFAQMGIEDYYVLPILLRRDYRIIREYLLSYVNRTLNGEILYGIFFGEECRRRKLIEENNQRIMSRWNNV